MANSVRALERRLFTRSLIVASGRISIGYSGAMNVDVERSVNVTKMSDDI
ncbi:MAG TPA: hypothetical protein VNE42_01460 [Acidimicrobiales bacterium]|nr:hypothetical protein [Acidimicrobiales bacterium]